MDAKPALYVLFTMNCEPVASRAIRSGPKTWDLSARSIEGFCYRLLRAGYPATLFISPECGDEHAPLFEELAGSGIELGLHIDPPRLVHTRSRNHLGLYDAEEQRAIVEVALDYFQEALGTRPRSIRSADFSANDATFKVLFELGFRQSSLSEPGRDITRHAAQWSGAEADAHYVDPDNRLRAGSLPFLEVPITTDPTEWYRRGIPYQLCIERGTFEAYQRPTADRHLERMAASQVAFRAICIMTSNQHPYDRDDEVHTATLDLLLDYLEELRASYEIMPVTLADAHERFRRLT